MTDLGTAFGAPFQQVADLAQTEANTRMVRVQTATMLNKLQQEQRMADLMSRAAAGPMSEEATTTDRLEYLANSALNAGLVEPALKLSNAVTLQRVRQSTINRNESLQDQADATSMEKQFKVARQILGTVNSQDSLDRANATWAASFGIMSPLAGRPYTPELIQQFNDNLAAQEGKQTSALREREQKRKEADSASLRSFRKYREGHLDRLEQIQRERNARVGKTGSTEIKAPSPGERKEAAALIRSEFTKQGLMAADLPEMEIVLAANQVASRARSLRQTNPGLDQTTAMHQAFEEAKRNGDLSFAGGYFGGTKAQYTPKGLAVDTPLPMEVDPNARVVGKYYRAPNGNTYQWQRGGWKLATPTTPDNEEDDTEDEE